MAKPFSSLHLALLAAVLAPACVPKANTVAVVPAAPVTAQTAIPWEQKLAWIVRLEDQRILRDPNPPPPVILRPATTREPALVAPPLPTDLLRLLQDPEAHTRRRAALAVGRVGLREGIEPLSRLFSDEEPEVRQMAAFAIGLIGDAAGRAPLLQALGDASPLVQGRAAEALGQIGDTSDAAAIGTMVQLHVRAGALTGIEPDTLTSPLAPPVEAARLGVYALVRLQSYDVIASMAMDASGQPTSRWWPIAYALQRVNDPRAAPALAVLATTPGRYTAAFAVRGLAASKAPQAVPILRQIVETRDANQAVVIQAIRGLASLADGGARPLLTRLVVDPATDAILRVEAMTALGTLVTAESSELLVDLVLDRAPAIRGLAMRALARVDPETFMIALASQDADRDWTVRTALAGALGQLQPEQALPLLTRMLDDRDPRVIPAVLTALAQANVPAVEAMLVQRLMAADFVTRATAANLLAERKATTAVPALREAYTAASNDSTFVARAALLTAIHRLNPAAARPLLQEALQDREWAVRVRAQALLREQGVTDTDAAMRPAPPRRPFDEAAWGAIVSPKYSPQAVIETDRGTIVIDLAVLDAPLTVDNFVTLARAGFFNGVAVHRMVPDFVVQGGDPRGDGDGGPGYAIRDELNQRPYLRGTVGMALDWKDTGGSQFFIMHSPAPHLDARYTAFGEVVSGMEIVDAMETWTVIRRVRIRDGVNPE